MGTLRHAGEAGPEGLAGLAALGGMRGRPASPEIDQRNRLLAETADAVLAAARLDGRKMSINSARAKAVKSDPGLARAFGALP